MKRGPVEKTIAKTCCLCSATTIIRWLRFSVTVLCLSASACQAQNWAGVLAPSRAVDWSSAGAGGFPNRTTVCATLNPGATAAQINAAIAACPSGQLVFLNAGTYSGLTGGLVAKSGVTLRGAGPDRTILQFSTSNGCGGEFADICVGGPNLYWSGSTDILPGGSHTHSWTGGYSRGATQITVDSTTGLSVGTIIVLDQADDSSDTGHFTVCNTPTSSPPCSLEGGAVGRLINGTAHNQQQYVQITGINGSTVSIFPGLYASNWSGSKSPGIFWTDPITGFGIEGMTLDHTNSDELAGISFVNAHRCWVSNVRSINGNRNHVWFFLSSHITVANSYFYGTKNSANLSYGVEWFLSGDDLVINNIFQHMPSPLMVGPTAGSVTAYNYGVDFFVGATGSMMPMFQIHDAGNMFNLYEANIGNSLRADVFHGTSNSSTLFRNQLTGFETSLANPKDNNLFAVHFMSHNRYGNVVGNVLGTSTVTLTYQLAFPTGGDKAVYSLGDGNTEGSVTVPGDSSVLPTMLRWGNYDSVTGATRWCGSSSNTGWAAVCGSSSEIPTGLADGYANALPTSGDTGAGQPALPPSFFLNAKPGWWGTTPPWPPIGPDVSGGDIANVGGHAYLIPAAACYLKVMGGAVDGTSGLLTFNGNSCYSLSSSPPPAPPPRVRATVN